MSEKTKNPVPETGIETEEELRAINAAQEAQIKELLANEEKLKAKIVEASQKGKPVSTEPTHFTIGKKEYPFSAPQFLVPGRGIVKASDALKDKALLQWLVENKAGAIE